MTAGRIPLCPLFRKTCVRRDVKMYRGFNTGQGVTFRYQARTDPPLSDLMRRKKGALIRPQGLDTSIFLRTHDKHFPTARAISAHCGESQSAVKP